MHRVTFLPSGRTALVDDGVTIADAAARASEPLRAECGGRGACGRCVVRIVEGAVPEYRVLRRHDGHAEVHACLTPVHGPLTVLPLVEAELPRLVARERNTGVAPLDEWAPWPLELDPIVDCRPGLKSGTYDEVDWSHGLTPGTHDKMTGRSGRPGEMTGDSGRAEEMTGDSGRRGAALGVAVDIGTTTLRALVIRLADGIVIGEASAYNPQIARGADVISRIVAAEKGFLTELSSLVRGAVQTLVEEAVAEGGGRKAEGGGEEAEGSRPDSDSIRVYVVAGNLTMIHLLLEADPSGIRQVPSEPQALRFAPVDAASLGWPGDRAPVHTMPAAGGWVGGDIVAGVVRAGFSRPPSSTRSASSPPRADFPPSLRRSFPPSLPCSFGEAGGEAGGGASAESGLTLYVDLGTNGEIALGGRDFALACACSAGPAFEGGGIRCGMRADRGAIDGARVDPDAGTLELSVIGGGRARGVCGSGLIALAHALFQAGWIDKSARLADALPDRFRASGEWGPAVGLTETGKIALWERDLASLLRAKGAIFAGIRSLVAALGDGARVDRAIVSGNFGRYLNLPAAIGIGLLPDLPLGRYSYVENGALEGAALALLSREFMAEVDDYLARITYINLSDVPHYMDELVAACFFPHTDPRVLQL